MQIREEKSFRALSCVFALALVSLLLNLQFFVLCVAYSAMESRRVSLNVNFHFHCSFASCFVFSPESTFARLE